MGDADGDDLVEGSDGVSGTDFTGVFGIVVEVLFRKESIGSLKSFERRDSLINTFSTKVRRCSGPSNSSKALLELRSTIVSAVKVTPIA